MWLHGRLLRYARNDKAGCHCEERSDEAISACRNFCGHLLAVSLLLPVMVLTACATSPLTQRQQIIFTNEQQELELGEMQYQKLLDTLVLNHDPEANRIVNTVGQRLARAAGKTNYVWEFVVVDNPKVANAWVLPGGKIGVHTGLFPVVQDEAGLAIILAHEVAHVLARHHGEKTTRDVLLELTGMGAMFAPTLLRQTYSLGVNFGLILPFGQVQEAEADQIGLILAAKAGYDPRVAGEVWQRLDQAAELDLLPAEFLTAHPNYGQRRQSLEKWLPEALSHFGEATAPPAEKLPALENLERPLGETPELLPQHWEIAPQLPTAGSGWGVLREERGVQESTQ
jgi:predicted Zn-dependent protease